MPRWCPCGCVAAWRRDEDSRSKGVSEVCPHLTPQGFGHFFHPKSQTLPSLLDEVRPRVLSQCLHLPGPTEITAFYHFNLSSSFTGRGAVSLRSECESVRPANAWTCWQFNTSLDPVIKQV